jgi:hypothetical protein
MLSIYTGLVFSRALQLIIVWQTFFCIWPWFKIDKTDNKKELLAPFEIISPPLTFFY